ncbi:MAG TPA: carboxypeptidase-like regulatory domain-containing protein [Flavobacteriaceae bacterium]|nr:carboxypeptidase-like regulatory domain-containing protein [Flavobacteriaceae bacterium]
MLHKKSILLFFFMVAFYGHAQKLISGTIIDAETEKPIEGVAIYFNKTAIWTLTDSRGNFELKIPKYIQSSLIINFLGYEQIIIEKPFSKENWDIRIHKQRNELNPVYIANQKKGKKQKTQDMPRPKNEYVDLFIFYFIGRGKASNKTKVLNKEVLQVNSQKIGNDTLLINISASEPLKIKNNYLKYKITYRLDTAQILFKKNHEFDMWIGANFQSAGNYFFRDLLDSEKRNRRFQQRRKKAYEGSVLHFMRALAHESLKKEGFFVFTINKNPKKNSNPHKKTRLDTVRFKLIPHKNYTEVLPPAIFSVIYKNEPPTKVIAKQNFGIGEFGNYFPWSALIFTGQMGFTGVSSAVPLDYVPEED